MEIIDSIAAPKKLAIGWFSFTCSEDSTILLTELLNDYMDEWKKVVEFRFFKALKSQNILKDLDVAFIEGAVSSEKQAAEVRKIRENSKYVVAVGSCACTGLPSASRNQLLSDKVNEKIRFYMSHFDYSDKVRKLSDVITIDDSIDGCPMNVPKFMEILKKYLVLFKIA